MVRDGSRDVGRELTRWKPNCSEPRVAMKIRRIK